MARMKWDARQVRKALKDTILADEWTLHAGEARGSEHPQLSVVIDGEDGEAFLTGNGMNYVGRHNTVKATPIIFAHSGTCDGDWATAHLDAQALWAQVCDKSDLAMARREFVVDTVGAHVTATFGRKVHKEMRKCNPSITTTQTS